MGQRWESRLSHLRGPVAGYIERGKWNRWMTGHILLTLSIVGYLRTLLTAYISQSVYTPFRAVETSVLKPRSAICLAHAARMISLRVDIFGSPLHSRKKGCGGACTTPAAKRQYLIA
ncbi:hypothetical protein BGW80DRAFT_1372325 [Lactifluus volemus]|nr:hypothetical protein BGW80DRAFT_1372325 [Lactifluus volemus]